MRRRLLLSYKNLISGFPTRKISIGIDEVELIYPDGDGESGARALVYNAPGDYKQGKLYPIHDLISYYEEHYIVPGQTDEAWMLTYGHFGIDFYDDYYENNISINAVKFNKERITIYGTDESGDRWHGMIYTDFYEVFYNDYARTFSFLPGSFILQEIQPIYYGLSLEYEYTIDNVGNRLFRAGEYVGESDAPIKVTPLIGILEYFSLEGGSYSQDFSFYVDMSGDGSEVVRFNTLETDVNGRICCYGSDNDGNDWNGIIFDYDGDISINGGSYDNDGDWDDHDVLIDVSYGSMLFSKDFDINDVLNW